MSKLRRNPALLGRDVFASCKCACLERKWVVPWSLSSPRMFSYGVFLFLSGDDFMEIKELCCDNCVKAIKLALRVFAVEAS